EDVVNGGVDGAALAPGAELALAGGHRLAAQIVQSSLVGGRLPADDERVGEVAAVAGDDDGVVEDEHVAGLEDAGGGRAAAPFRAGRDGEIAVDDDGVSGGSRAGGVDAAVDVELGHAGRDVGPRPGMPGLGGAHAVAQQLDLVGVFLPAHLGDGADDGG